LFSAIGCLLGGIYHIFVPNLIVSPYANWLWAATLLCVGIVALIGLEIIWYFINPRLNWKLSLMWGSVIFLSYAYFILQYPQFKYASMFIGMMVLGQLLLGIVLGLKTSQWFWGVYVLGWLAYILGAVIQFLKISLSVTVLSYNTLYHFVSAIAWLMIFFAAKHLEPKD
jgi:hypothetical protein